MRPLTNGTASSPYSYMAEYDPGKILTRNALHGCFAAQILIAARPRRMGSIVER